MNISSTKAHRPRPNVQTSKKNYQEAEASLEARSKNHFAKAKTYVRANTIASVAGGAVGAYVAFSGILNGSIQHGIVGAAPIILGVGVAGGLSLLATRHLTKSSTLPDFRAAKAEYSEAREQYREALLQDMNDPEVGKATNEKWSQHRQWENRLNGSLNVLSTTQGEATKQLRGQLQLLEDLAESRKSGGWTGELAALESDPKQFAEQKALVAKYPNFKAVLESSGE